MASSAAAHGSQRPPMRPIISADWDHHRIIQLDDFSSHIASAEQQPPPAGAVSAAARSSFKHLFTFTPARHIPLVALSFTTAALVAAGRTAYAVLLGRIFDVVTRFGTGLLSHADFLAQISQWAVWLCVLGAGMWVVSTADAAAWVVGGELRARTARREVFWRLLMGKEVGWFEAREEGVGGLTASVATQTRELQTATSQTLGYLVCDVFVFAACLVVAFVYSYKLTLVMLATGVPSALILWGIGRFLDPAIEAQKRELAQAAKHVTAATTAIDLVKVYNAADHEAFTFTSAIRRSARYYSRQAMCNCGQMGYVKLWMITLFVLGFSFAVVQVKNGELSPGDALTTFYAALIAFQSIEMLGPHWLVLAKGMAAGQLLRGLVDESGSGQLGRTAGCLKPSGCLGIIEMNTVSFAYPSNFASAVIRPSNLRFEPGRLTFVIGRSGSGKSTLGSLLVRFYEPLTGQIMLDDNPITEFDLNWLRQNVTLIQQSSSIFGDSFFKNVALGAMEPDNVPLDAVQSACSMALLQSTISSLPNGLDTTIGPGGYGLSGGQRQRLALARAKLRDPPVLILDEITSGLDPVSRNLIMEGIRAWRKDKTTIIITHEVGDIKDDEYVYVLADGSVAQEGLKREVAKDEGGLFASFVASAETACSGTDSETESESDSSDDEPLQESQYARSPRGALISNQRMPVGLFQRISLGPRATIAQESICRSITHKMATNEPVTVNISRTSSIRIIAQQGLAAQGSRTLNARQALQTDLDPELQVSLDSLDRFFLERLAKPRGRESPSKGTQLPSLAAILKTVWPTLDRTGKAQLIAGIALCLVVAGSNPVFSFFFANLIGQFWNMEGQKSSVPKFAGLLAAIAAIDASATFFGYFLMEQVAQKWVNNLRAEAIKRILRQPKSWFDKANHSPARITQCLDRNAEEMRKLVGMFVPILLTISTMMLSSLIWALVVRWDLTLVTLAGVPAVIAAARANSLTSDKWEAACDETATATNAIFSEALANIRVVRALTLERYFSSKFSRSVAATYHLGVKRAGFIGFFYGLHQSIVFFLTALVFFYGAKILGEGGTTVTDVVRVINLLLFSLGTAVAMLANVPQIAAAKATAVQMLYYANLSHAASHESRGERRLFTPLPVRMTNLRFAYPSAPQTQVLRNINLQFDAGTCTAIVGASGCGKSTIVSLLLRLYDPLQEETDPARAAHRSGSGAPISPIPESPSTPRCQRSPFPSATATTTTTTTTTTNSTTNTPPLTYASVPSSHLHTPSLRSRIAYVPQTPVLFPGTVRANLTYGLHEASPLRAEANVVLAAQQAGIHPFVASLPQGYDTPLGDGGGAPAAVSGGQAQRLCIARALARRPRLLVLDEPTSALDAEAAAEVRRVLRRLVEAGGMAVVVVTHSKEMMRMADRVVMIEGGVVAEQGGYDELMTAPGGKFRALVEGGVWTAGEGGYAEEMEGKGKGKRKKKEKEKKEKRGAVRSRDVERSREETLRRLEGKSD
ncbi:P-loop containing nucleoside triphosphate hydrolase protein [Thermothelomyces heterothallicus CBS 202.75]|uniref:P-loop containing nucleoside triphosphate hydrolase protein n=1 Tax=Thermothelomyces heterothallicus CBS 202.75 TaxID=1149848 RepID=UPI00374324B0